MAHQTPGNDFKIGSLYLAGFAQARAPHVGLLIPTSSTEGTLFHIRIDRQVSPNWAFQKRKQKIAGDMFLSSLLRIADGVTVEMLEDVVGLKGEVEVPENDVFGECFDWVMRVVRSLKGKGLMNMVNGGGENGDLDELKKEFREFVEGNRAYARRDRFPNVATYFFVLYF
ncbi:hypothetical protein K435DRAFT_785158 [Dendrothele bispora CBS 962.96]|uniref:Uncharacterized protein n=1 Tax=Dendrothele bispora (strain CBS 962.96) TaxID=1314807 RepID=A0A4S8KYH4_DENBC|nr:hypothetical protein K435DRAFT_785158 [Dendrothele bispora CBS 962.96]